MRTIRCNQYGPPDSLTLEDSPDLVPGPGQVVIDVKAAAVNFPDVLIIENKYQMKPPLPFTPGAELAGVVRAAGEGVKLAPGMRVVAYVGTGAFAEQALADASACVALPEGADFATAAAFTLAYGTSHHAVVDRAALRAGETMLVLGAAGGVGLAAVEIGKVLGARVIAAASSEEKLEVCRRFGADATINYSTEDLRERIKALTDGNGPDVIYDPVGGEYAEPAFRSIGWRGRYLVVGFANGEIPRLPLNLALLKGASLVGVFWGDFARREPQRNAAAFAQMMGWIGEGKLKPYVSKRYRLADTAQALKDMASRKVTGKIVIEP
ncbi:NADPH:quinone oxidoreductase family protein [Paraburkholderia silvatlantica]|uniref:NADPH2:quinone reductase n=1 Tax=Paraburkholderia silvatlantica TaxID=321895 RepID=A0ABR6FM22_9BURK|nr:NADPH:quinone oxidoreductase family protein [Paraburkholderia silvatlantica]MBB2928478.1 NADPH2:quinone reductase [Paraburkholderia silvatlantica]PVY34478.1 NADPH:quinone reductase-like Zn-dependent oxidoreductase [Paraburkholderia silvatlantica]PXW38693.1 NADPH:quinone reductase-like Zn-dependent oxidoreductase [Paraburkholderia silvatlantica]TDQ89566.1 NADPH:quinone reductase-like Zn-dependent oxidoreductase [Paraburkholderia silvatlantica]